MFYALFNKGNNRCLIHPVVGLWATNDLQEAKDMLEDCKKYLTYQGLQNIVNDFVIVDAETKAEI
jgi:hypothetical protein